MRGDDREPAALFSYISTEARVPADHPLRAIRVLVDGILQQMSPAFDALYAAGGRPSIPPERLLRAQLLQLFYTVRSERLLMEQLDYNVLFRWFVGLELDEAIWDPTVFMKNRDRLLTQAVAQRFFQLVVARRRPGCRTSMSPSTARSSRRGPVTRVFNGRTGAATGTAAIFAARPGRTTRTRRRRIRTPACTGSRMAPRHGSPIWATCRVERVFGWVKPIAGLRKIKLRGLAHVEWLFLFACAAFNVKRLTALRAAGGTA